MKHLNGDLRALLLVQSGVKEIHTAPLKVATCNCNLVFLLFLDFDSQECFSNFNFQEAVTVLKGRVVKQLEALGQVHSKTQIHSSENNLHFAYSSFFKFASDIIYVEKYALVC